MGPYAVRRATAGEVSHWRAVRLAMLLDAPRAFSSTYAGTVGRSDDDLVARLETTWTWLAWEGDRPVGSVGMGTFEHLEAEDAALIGMWVAPPARGRGLGDLLVGTVLTEAAAQGFSRVVLDVAQENAAARALYDRHGFIATGRTWRHPEDGGIDEVEMARPVGRAHLPPASRE